MSKIYATLHGVEYKDWNVYINGYDNKEYLVLDDRHCNEIIHMVDSITYTPSLGSDLFIMPNCKLAAADIRKNYKVKRNPADASAIVVSDFMASYDWNRIEYYYAIPERRTIFIQPFYASWKCSTSLEEFAFSKIDDLQDLFNKGKVIKYTYKDEKDMFKYFPIHNFKGILEVYNGTLNLPLIPYKSLPIINDNELDIETLQMFFNVGLITHQSNCIENFKIQMQALNQTNWRSYKGTLSMIYKLLKKNKYSAAGEVFNRPSCLPKAAKELHSVMSSDNVFELRKDADMARQFLETVVEFDPSQYLEIESLRKKFENAKVDFSYFYKLYDNIVKIRPKCIGE